MSGQNSFRAALLDPALPPFPGLTDGRGLPAEERFDIYRNNVAVSLTEALELAFPIVRRLVGEAFFAAMTAVYLRRHPPASPVLQQYGQEMPAFLHSFPPAQRLPYLPDIARLELALRRAYHAADAAPFDPHRLQGLAPAALNGVSFRFAAAVSLLRSDHPVHGIWRRNTDPAAPLPVPRPENVLVTRPGYDPQVTPLDAPQAVFVRSLTEGQSLSAALLRVARVPGRFDLADTLGLLFRSAALTDIQT